MEAQRKIGIDLVPQAPWGTHFCLFYRTPQDLLDLLVPYFKAGLENDEFCMWVTAEPLRAGDARQALRTAVKDFDAYARRGQIEILDYTEWYTLSGHFDSERVLSGWIEKEKNAVQRGFAGLRLTGNTFWLEAADWRAFIDYEAAVDNVISQYRMIALCTYSLDKCGASEVIDVTNHHQFALAKRAGRWEMIESADRRRAEEAQRHAAELKARVAERTRELQDLNAQLKKENAERQKKEKELAGLNRTLKAHNRSSQALMRAEEEKEYLNQVCRIIVEDCGHAMVWIGFAENDRDKSVRIAAYSGFEQGYLETLKLTWADTERGRGPTGMAIRTGKPTGCPNMLTDPRFLPWREEAIKRGYASSMALPLLKDGKAFGALMIYARETEAFSEQEVALLADLAGDLAYGITMLRLRRAHARAEEALRAQRELFETVVNYMPAAVNLIRGQDLSLQLVNPAYQAIAPGKQMLGKTLDELWPETGQAFGEICRQVLATGEPYMVQDELNMVQRRPEGPLEPAYFSWSLHRVRLPGDEGWGILNTAWETTERKLAEDRIRKLNQDLEQQAEELQVANVHLEEQAEELQVANVHLEEQAEELRVANTNIEEALAQEQTARAEAEERQRILEQREQSLRDAMREIERLNRDLKQRAGELEGANKELESFSYSVSHDLRMPLAAVEGFARLLAEEGEAKLSPEGQEYLRLVRENTSAMSRLIEGLLSFSRTSRQPLNAQTVQPAEMVRQILTELCPAQDDRPREIVIGELPECEADPVLLKQVWVNLLSNAIKFTRTREVARIKVGSVRSDGSPVPGGEEQATSGDRLRVTRRPAPVTFFVKDNGVGFDVKQAESLFGVFQRFHKDEEFEGTGVGLAIVERIIRRHGGRVWAEAEVGQGATFYFTLE